MTNQGQRTNSDIWYALAEEESRELLASLPDDLRECLAPLAVTLDPRPTPDEETQAGDETELLGLFVGLPFGAPPDDSDPLPCAIRLFVENLREEAEDDPLRFRQEVRTTLLHEIGHYLGLDEEGLAARGLA